MSQGLFIQLGLMLAAAVFAVLVSVSPALALAGAGGVVLCAGAARRLEDLPRLGLLLVTALVPLSYLGTRVALGSFNSLTKLVFIPAFAILVVERILTGRRIVLGWPSLFVFLFGLALMLSCLVNERTDQSLWFLSRFASMMLLFFLTTNALRDERHVAALLAVMAGSCLVSALGALITPPPPIAHNVLHGTVRMAGWSLEDSPTFGTNALVGLLICVYFLFVSRHAGLRVLLFLASGVLALSITQTLARGVSLAAALSVGLLLLKLMRREQAGWVLLSMLLLALVVVPCVPDAYWERMTTIVTRHATDPTLHRRIDSYRIGLRLFEQHPFLGIGPGNFIAQYMSPEFRFERAGVPSVLFNLYLSIASQAGLVGLAAFALIVAGVFRELRFVVRSFEGRETLLKHSAEILGVVLAAILLISFFEPTDLQKYLWIVLGAAVAVGHIRREQLAMAPATPAEAG